MKKQDKFRCEGEVVKMLPNASFSIQLAGGHLVTAYASGRMRKAKVKVLLGDRVEVELSSYDPTKGIVVHRHTKSSYAGHSNSANKSNKSNSANKSSADNKSSDVNNSSSENDSKPKNDAQDATEKS